MGSYRSRSIYQLHIQLEEIEPAIWRRISVPGKISLARLHRLLQLAMGWENYHLHLFTISASLLAIGKPHGVILYQLPGLGIRLRGLQITQGEFIDSIFILHRHDGAIGLVQEDDGQHADPGALTNRPALIFFHGGGKREDQVLLQVGMPGPKHRQLVVTLCPVHDRLNPLALFVPGQSC